MRLRKTVFVAALTMTLAVIACRQAQTSEDLPRATANDCKQGVYLLEIPKGRDFAVNHTIKDSASLASWINQSLSKREASLRIVFVRVDSTRRQTLSWILPAMRAVEAKTFAEDGTCKPIVRQSSNESSTQRSEFRGNDRSNAEKTLKILMSAHRPIKSPTLAHLLEQAQLSVGDFLALL